MEMTNTGTGEATAAVTPATTAESGGGGEFVRGDGSFSEGWQGHLPAELGEAREAFTRFKSVGDLAKSYHGLQQLMGKKAQAVVVPTEKSSSEEVAAYRKALGVPERIEEYSLKPEGLPEGVEWSEELARPFAEIAHRHHIPPAAMRELVAQQARVEALRGQTASQMAQAELARAQESLKQAWGAQYERNLGLAQRAAKMAGVDAQSRGFTDPEVVKAFSRLADMLSEDHFVKSEGSGLQGGADRARDIMTNANNPLHAKYRDGEADTVDLVRGLLRRG